MYFFYGNLVQDKELAKTAKIKKKPYHEKTVSKAEQADYLAKGWTAAKPLKTRVRLHKDKEHDELLEDKVWLLFKNMGFTEMNKDRNFKIQAGPIQKQIDVFAKDGNDVFVVECKASAEGAPISRKDIHEISNLKKDIADSIRKEYDNKNIRVSFVIATQDMLWSEDNEDLAKKNGIFVWKEAELKSYGGLIQHLGVSARFPIYSILFKGKKIPVSKRIKVPALFGGKGNEKYYSFLIEPEKLLQVSYVHRRESGLEEILDSYQRMAEKKRLRRISAFITGGGYFVNNIILSFREKPTFHMDKKEKQVGGAVAGMLEFPPHYASAWIIDGQHRLYGYADNKRRKTDVIPVIAFESLSTPEQAKLFVQINKEQKAVKANLLWDLYPDIYGESEDKEQQHLRAVSLLVKRLNSDSDSKLHCHIGIYSHSALYKGRNITNLTLNTVCEALKESGLINKENPILYKDDYETTVNFVSEILKSYFEVIAESFPEDWEMGEKGLLRSNIGIRILFIILRQLMLYLKYAGREGIYRKKDLSEFRDETRKLVNPMLAKLKDMSDEERSKIRKQTAKGPLAENARQMAWWIKEEFDGFGLELLLNWAPPRPKELSDEDIRQNLEGTEINLRDFIARELKKLYGEPWWSQGVPQGVKNKASEKIAAEIKKTPWKKDELSSLPPERKLNFIDTPDLREIIQCGSNWEHFKHMFIEDKEYTGAQFKSFEYVRNKYQHFAEDECDEITKNLGYWGMRWIGKCMGL